MTETFNGCKVSNVWVTPKNWETTTAKSALSKEWFVNCEFFDPSRNKKFQFRRKINRIKSIEGRRKAVKLLLVEIPKLFFEKGWNPITKTYMAPPMERLSEHENPLSERNSLAEALELAIRLGDYKDDTLKDIKSIKHYFLKSAQQLKYDTTPVVNIKGIHVDLIMHNLVKKVRPISDKRYNKYLVYLHRLFEILRKKGLLSINPLEDFEKKKTLVEKRVTLSAAERVKIDNYLKVTMPSFWLFCNIFFHSGCREVELLGVKYEDVDLDNLTLKVLVKKGKGPTIEHLPIKKVAVVLWEKAMINAKKGDYIFSVGLIPGQQRIRRDQITRRWRVHVKKKLGIEADIYSLKHSNLTEISKRTSAKEAARAAGHKSERMIVKHYDVDYTERQKDSIRNMSNEFAPSGFKKKTENEYCAPAQFGFMKLKAAI